MEPETKDKAEFIDKLQNFYNNNKLKIFISTIILIIIFIVFIFLKINLEKKNNLIAENYIKAGIYLNSGDKQKSKIIYEEIINSKNKFYSILALNNIVENELEEDNDEILKLFSLVEKIKINKDQKDLIKLKKALYFIKISKFDEGNVILQEIITNDSKWKNIASEIIK